MVLKWYYSKQRKTNYSGRDQRGAGPPSASQLIVAPQMNTTTLFMIGGWSVLPVVVWYHSIPVVPQYTSGTTVTSGWSRQEKRLLFTSYGINNLQRRFRSIRNWWGQMIKVVSLNYKIMTLHFPICNNLPSNLDAECRGREAEQPPWLISQLF